MPDDRLHVSSEHPPRAIRWPFCILAALAAAFLVLYAAGLDPIYLLLKSSARSGNWRRLYGIANSIFQISFTLRFPALGLFGVAYALITLHIARRRGGWPLCALLAATSLISYIALRDRWERWFFARPGPDWHARFTRWLESTWLDATFNNVGSVGGNELIALILAGIMNAALASVILGVLTRSRRVFVISIAITATTQLAWLWLLSHGWSLFYFYPDVHPIAMIPTAAYHLAHAALLFTWARSIRRRDDAGVYCSACGYSLLGLPPTAPCPECGKPPAVSQPATQ